jgi:anti-sigma factor RsiW
VTPLTPAMDCHEARMSLGVYVLGAIEPAERALVDSHLATCRDCRDELAGLAGLPALLARVSVPEAMALAAADGPAAAAPPRQLLAAVLDLTAARQRRRRWREAALGVAAALVIAAGVFGGLRLGSGPAPASSSASAPWPGPANGNWETATGQSGSMTAAVTYRSMGWGVQLAAQVSGIPGGTHCQLWVISATGQRALAGSWLTDGNEGTVWYPASAALAAKDIAGFQITVGQGQAIVINA